ncbi:Hypothetical predicted protein [Marmota monax]|uniref:Fibronectin type-III domain-containing protein n=1 Tax=Marmota monax TaxID=9995 RepID=A0A5E4BTN9_MARMO|nr:Hypothetical predicted protein [Marmota monax]
MYVVSAQLPGANTLAACTDTGPWPSLTSAQPTSTAGNRILPEPSLASRPHPQLTSQPREASGLKDRLVGLWETALDPSSSWPEIQVREPAQVKASKASTCFQEGLLLLVRKCLADSSEHDCSPAADCINVEGSYACQCRTTRDANPSRAGRASLLLHLSAPSLSAEATRVLLREQREPPADSRCCGDLPPTPDIHAEASLGLQPPGKPQGPLRPVRTTYRHRRASLLSPTPSLTPPKRVYKDHSLPPAQNVHYTTRVGSRTLWDSRSVRVWGSGALVVLVVSRSAPLPPRVIPGPGPLVEGSPQDPVGYRGESPCACEKTGHGRLVGCGGKDGGTSGDGHHSTDSYLWGEETDSRGHTSSTPSSVGPCLGDAAHIGRSTTSLGLTTHGHEGPTDLGNVGPKGKGVDRYDSGSRGYGGETLISQISSVSGTSLVRTHHYVTPTPLPAPGLSHQEPQAPCWISSQALLRSFTDQGLWLNLALEQSGARTFLGSQARGPRKDAPRGDKRQAWRRGGAPQIFREGLNEVGDGTWSSVSGVLLSKNTWIDSTLAFIFHFLAPVPIERVTVSNVTSTSFHLAWVANLTLHPTFRLSLASPRSPAVGLETGGTSMTVSGLEPGILHLVEIVAKVCGEEGARAHLKVRTGKGFRSPVARCFHQGTSSWG